MADRRRRTLIRGALLLLSFSVKKSEALSASDHRIHPWKAGTSLSSFPIRRSLPRYEGGKTRPYLHPLGASRDGGVNDDETQNMASKHQKPSFKTLFQLTRPSNFPTILLLHLIGSYLALNSIGTSVSWSIMTNPLMICTLFALFLTSATSMIVNDYYDAKLGRDKGNDRPLVTGEVSFAEAKNFLSYLYGAALVCVAILPGVTTRISVLMGLVLTYYYTQYLKPITWVKNIVCALLIALSPLTSGSAAIHLVTDNPWSLGVTRAPSLLRLTGMLFFGLLAREIMMDCNDVENDRGSHVHTIPVEYGQKFASGVSLLSTLLACALAMGGPLLEVVRFPSSLYATRRLTLSTVGGFMQSLNAWKVFRTGGAQKEMTDRAIEGGFISVLFLLLSFV